MKKGKKVLLIILGIIICIFIVAAFYLNRKKDTLIPHLINSLNESIEGNITYKDVSLVPFKHFPNVSISINKPLLALEDSSGLDSIIYVEHIDLSFDVLRLIRSEIQLEKLSVYGGKLSIKQHADSTFNIANALLIKKHFSDSSTSETKLDLNIDKLTIENVAFELIHINHALQLRSNLNDLRASFSYGKDSLVCSLQSESYIKSLSITNGNSIKDEEFTLNTSFNYNFNTKTAKINDGHLSLSNALINLNGSVELKNEKNIQLNFEADDSNLQFTKLFFTERKEQIVESGNIFLKGSIKGSLYDEIPFIKLSFGAQKLCLAIPETKHKIKNLDFQANFESGNRSDLSQATLIVDSIRSELPNGHLKGTVSMSDFTNPYMSYDLALETDLDGFDNLLKNSVIDSVSGHIKVKNKFIGYLALNDSIQSDSINIILAKMDSVSFNINHEFIFKNISSSMHSENAILFLDSTSLNLNNSLIKLEGSIKNYLAFIFKMDVRAKADLSLSTALYDFPDFFSYSPQIASSFPYAVSNVNLDLSLTTSIKDLSEFSRVPKMDFKINYLKGEIDSLCPPIEITNGIFNMADYEESATFDFRDFKFTLANNPVALDLYYSFSNRIDSLALSTKLKSFNLGGNMYLNSLSFLNDTTQLTLDKDLQAQIVWKNDSSEKAMNLLIETDDLRFSTDTVLFSCKEATLKAQDIKNINAGNFPFSTMDAKAEIDCKEIYSPVYIDKNITYLFGVENGALLMKSEYEAMPFKEMDLSINARPFDSIPQYAINYKLNDVELNDLFPSTKDEKIIHGGIDFILNIEFEGIDTKAILSSLDGDITLNGDSLTLEGIDLDKLIGKFERSQNFNLVDLGAVMIAGPVGILYSKGSSYALLLVGDKSDSSIVNHVYSKWDINKGKFLIDDFALATDENRVAIKGWIDLQTDSLDLNMALIDANGCSIVSQSLKGDLEKPNAGKVKFVKTVIAPVTNLVNDVLGVDCDVFYDGVVKASKKGKTSKND